MEKYIVTTSGFCECGSNDAYMIPKDKFIVLECRKCGKTTEGEFKKGDDKYDKNRQKGQKRKERRQWKNKEKSIIS